MIELEKIARKMIEGANQLSKNRGKVIFNRNLLLEGLDQETLKEVFSNFYPFHSELSYSSSFGGDIIMTGFSEHFRELGEGEIIPTYNLTINQEEKGGVSIYFKELRI